MINTEGSLKMKKGAVPFYGGIMKDETTFTLFVDPRTAVVYRANNTSLSKKNNFIAIVFVLILLRLTNGIPLSYDFPIYILFLTVFSILLGIGIGISFYKSIQGELRSIDITKETMEEIGRASCRERV